MTLGLLLAIPAVALADNIEDDIADDTTTPLALVKGDANSTATAEIKVVGNASSGDPDSGCNFDTTAESLTIAFTTPTGVTATAQDGATATAGQMKFTGCGTNQTVQFQASNAATAGNYTVTATVVTNATDGTFKNNVSIPLTISNPPDNTPPATPTLDLATASDSGSSNTDDITNDNTPTFEGFAEAGSTVKVYNVIDANTRILLGSAVANGAVDPNNANNKAWSFTPSSALNDGTYTIKATATDAANNTSGDSSGLSVRIDTVANAPTGLNLTTASDSGSSNTDDITNDNTPTIDGSAEANGSVELFEGTTSLGTGSANNSGVWSITSSTLTPNGQHTLKAQVTDVAGNVSALSSGLVVTIDTVNPVVTFGSGITAGGAYDFGSVPANPGCTATDTGGSGVTAAGCSVTGYSTAVGNHTLTGSATDVAGNTGQSTLSYTVNPWDATGFYSPVGTDNSVFLPAPDALPTMNDSGVWNTVKGGSTVPLKFNVFAGGTEKTSTSDIQALQATKLTKCASDGAATADVVDFTTTETTSLRYSGTPGVDGQFIQNWKTPKVTAETCYRTAVTLDDGSSIYAFFKLLK